MRNVKSVTSALLLGGCLWLAASPPLQAAGAGTQQRAAEEFLTALARGDAQALSMSILEDELVALRKGLLDQMKLEADRDESLTRQRLFGDGMQLADIERLTPQNFFVALSQRLRFGGREFRKVDWLEVVKDRGGLVHLVGRLEPPEDMGEVRVPVLVSLVPWGKDWKAALPLDLQAQIEDLRSGRTRVASRPATAATTPGSTGAAGPATPPAIVIPQPILTLLDTALENLAAKRCDVYYDKQMSPNFRRTTGTRALRTLISACESRDTLREQYMTAIRLARTREPRFEYAGTRAVFDLAGTGLPFSRWIVELVDERWYIAE